MKIEEAERIHKARIVELEQQRDELLAALEPIVDCYGVGHKSAERFTDAVGPFIMEARDIIARIKGSQT